LDGWCRLHFGFDRNRASQLIYFKEIVDALKMITPVINLPTEERPLRPLIKYRNDPTKLALIWNKGVELAGGVVPAEDNLKAAIEQITNLP
jgi:hypothetical protein